MTFIFQSPFTVHGFIHKIKAHNNKAPFELDNLKYIYGHLLHIFE